MKTKLKICLQQLIRWQPFSETEKLVDQLIDRCFQAITIDKKVAVLRYQDDTLINSNNYFITNSFLKEKLTSCHQVVFGLVTLGENATTLLNQYQNDPYAAYILHEMMCYLLEEELHHIYQQLISSLAPRDGLFMLCPGEKDVPLAIQDEIFAVLKPQDITIDNETKLMVPLKTISFIIGIASDIPIESFDDRCNRCGYIKCSKKKIPVTIDNHTYDAYINENLLDLMRRQQIQISSQCGKKGTCKQCVVEIEHNGRFQDVLACQTHIHYPLIIKTKKITQMSQILTTFHKPNDVTPDADSSGLGIAIDLGTTTIVISLYDKQTAKPLRTISEVNMQQVYGVDIMHRISYTMEEDQGLFHLKTVVWQQIQRMLTSLPMEHVNEIIIVGNPTMISIIAGKSIKPLGVYPFTSDVNEMITLSGEIFGLKQSIAIVLPFAASAFIGSDVLSGIIASQLRAHQKNHILIDLGTNGEIVLSTNNKLYATSTAAGPAFEGGNISCGVAAINGAVYHYRFDGIKMVYKTIGHEPPIGFCGSGVIDVMASLLQNKVINESGHIVNQQNTIEIALEDSMFIIKQKDIREFQLAKSAIVTGIKLLLNEAAIDSTRIDAVFIAGGFGSQIELQSLIEVGLIPKIWESKTSFVGNSALYGASLYLLNKNIRKDYETLKNKVTTIQSFASPKFNDWFVENLSLEKKGKL